MDSFWKSFEMDDSHLLIPKLDEVKHQIKQAIEQENTDTLVLLEKQVVNSISTLQYRNHVGFFMNRRENIPDGFALRECLRRMIADSLSINKEASYLWNWLEELQKGKMREIDLYKILILARVSQFRPGKVYDLLTYQLKYVKLVSDYEANYRYFYSFGKKR